MINFFGFESKKQICFFKFQADNLCIFNISTGNLLLYDPLLYDYSIYKTTFCPTQAFFYIIVTYLTTNPRSRPAVTHKVPLRPGRNFIDAATRGTVGRDERTVGVDNRKVIKLLPVLSPLIFQCMRIAIMNLNNILLIWQLILCASIEGR